MTTIESINIHILTDGIPQVVVSVTDKAGLAGFGECWWGIPDSNNPVSGGAPIAAAVEHIIKPRYLGKDSRRTQQLWFDCQDYAARYGDGGIITMGLSGVDMALWDLNAKRMGVSVLEMLGGPVRDFVPAYASFPPLRDPELLVQETRRAINYGFGAVKLHEIDPHLTRYVREEGGPDLKIMADVNGHFDHEEAVSAGEVFASYGVHWYEEPVRPMRDIEALGAVAAELSLDIAAGENEYSLHDFRRMIDSGVVRYLQPEITKIGGITPAVRIGALANAGGLALCPHNFRPGLALAASMHWGFSSPAISWFELPWVPESASFASGAPIPAVIDGSVVPPVGTGLGVALG